MDTYIKICGITSRNGAAMAAASLADAIGLMFYEPSPRFVSLESAENIAAAIPESIQKVGVFVNAEPDYVREAIDRCGLDVAQFHGDESPEYCAQFETKVWKAFRIRDKESLRALPPYETDAWLLDSYVKGQPGGTGEKFNWDLAVAAKELGRPILLAGGLTAANVADAVRHVRPFGLDVSSGVESAPGRKDPDKVHDFIYAAKTALSGSGSGDDS
ncbi:MAG: phosphoribosylanthranilate isomerase [Limisphaerales bacterium]|jgi:phosphoribosylanthranilate isomerase